MIFFYLWSLLFSFNFVENVSALTFHHGFEIGREPYFNSLQDKDGFIWVATDKGLNQLFRASEKFKRYQFTNYPDLKVVNNLQENNKRILML